MSRVLPIVLAVVLATAIPFVRSADQTFPIGTCRRLESGDGVTNVDDGPSCLEMCEVFNLTESTGTTGIPGVDLNCDYDEDEDTQNQTCKDAKFKRFSECQQSIPETGPYDRSQCVCGADEIVLCDSDYHTDYTESNGSFVHRRPPLECESMNITSIDTCIDVATLGGQDFYCNKSSTPCNFKYEKIGDYMMCSYKWRKGSWTVLCGDACAYTTSKGTHISGIRTLGLAISVATYILF